MTKHFPAKASAVRNEEESTTTETTGFWWPTSFGFVRRRVSFGLLGQAGLFPILSSIIITTSPLLVAGRSVYPSSSLSTTPF